MKNGFLQVLANPFNALISKKQRIENEEWKPVGLIGTSFENTIFANLFWSLI